MIEVTTFKGLRYTSPIEVTTLEKVLDDIKSDKWKSQIEKCHIDITKKDFLPCFTPTGIFNHRSIAGLEKYNGIICLDIDHVENPSSLKDKIIIFNWVHAAYITPSGHGLKVIIKTNANVENYKIVEALIAERFKKATGFDRDNRCKDIARIQFISHDPNLIYNENSETLLWEHENILMK